MTLKGVVTSFSSLLCLKCLGEHKKWCNFNDNIYCIGAWSIGKTHFWLYRQATYFCIETSRIDTNSKLTLSLVKRIFTAALICLHLNYLCSHLKLYIGLLVKHKQKILLKRSCNWIIKVLIANFQMCEIWLKLNTEFTIMWNSSEAERKSLPGLSSFQEFIAPQEIYTLSISFSGKNPELKTFLLNTMQNNTHLDNSWL